MAYHSKNPKFDSMVLDDQASDSVANPASGSYRLLNRNGDTYVKDSSGNERFVNVGKYVGTNPEVGGSTPFILTIAHKPVQVINPAGAITVELPTTGVLAGDIWVINNRSSNTVTVRASDDVTIGTVVSGSSRFTALQATPTTNTHWEQTTEQFASATNSGAVSTTTQTFAGAKTFSSAITASAGIILGAETLSNYDEGTSTIAAGSGVTFSTSSSGLVSVTSNAYWVRVGRLVTLTGYLNIQKGSSSGNLRLDMSAFGTSQPPPSQNLTNNYAVGHVIFTAVNDVTKAGYTHTFCLVPENSSYIEIRASGVTTPALAFITAADLDTDVAFFFTVTYRC